MSNWYNEALIDVTDPEAVVVSHGATEKGEGRICLSLPGDVLPATAFREANKDLNVLALTPEVARVIWEALDSQFAPERAREWAAQMREAVEAARKAKST